MTKNVIFNYKIIDSTFCDCFTDLRGSAIYYNSYKSKVFMYQCVFYNCSSLGIGSSSHRKSGVSGGACFFDINTINVNYCKFFWCNAKDIGSAMYACGQRGSTINISCLSLLYCNKDNNSCVFCIERSNFNLKNVNSSWWKSI